jgi:hypothetical protein
MLSLRVQSPSHEPRENVGSPRCMDEDVDQDLETHPFASLSNFEQHDTIGVISFNGSAAYPVQGTGKFGCVHLVKNFVNHQYYVMKVLNKKDTIRMKQVDHTRNEREVLSLVRSQPFFTHMYVHFVNF